MNEPLVLVTNDDGIFSEGILTLAQKIATMADVYVVAPASEKSATSHSITIDKPLRVEKVALAGLPLKDRAFSVDGTPADCVKLAISKLLPRRPDWVISGINLGGNLAQDTLYSGTVNAAMEGLLAGCPAIAVSVHNMSEMDFQFETAAYVVEQVFRKRRDLEFAHANVLNINVPNVSIADLKGIIAAPLGYRNGDASYLQRRDPRGRLYYWLGLQDLSFQAIEGSDCQMIEEGYATVTALRASLFDQHVQDKLKKFNFLHRGEGRSLEGAVRLDEL